MGEGGPAWNLTVVITEAHRQAHRPWAAWAVGVVGLLFAALFQVLMLGTTGRAAVIERKNEALRASEERYQRLFDESPLPMWVYDAEGLRFLMVNDRAVAHYGWSRPEFLSLRLPDLFPPGDGAGALAGHGLREVHECQHVRRDGSRIDVVVRSSPARYGDSERPPGGGAGRHPGPPDPGAPAARRQGLREQRLVHRRDRSRPGTPSR